MLEELLKQQAMIALMATIVLGVIKALMVKWKDEDTKAWMPAITLVLMIATTFLVSEARDINADVFDIVSVGVLTAGTPTLIHEGQKQVQRIAPVRFGPKRQ